MPLIGDAHPDVPACLLRKKTGESISADAVKVTLHYSVKASDDDEGQPDFDTIQTGSSVISTQTNKDFAGNNITVEYKSPADAEENQFWTGFKGKTHEQGGFLTILKPQTTLIRNQKEAVDPLNKSRTYVGKMNDATFQGDAIGTWLCTRLNGVSNDGGANWTVTYEFQWRVETWKGVLVYILPTGKPPSDLINNVGVQSFIIYDDANFNLVFS